MDKNIVHDVENQKIYYKNFENICLKYKKEIICIFENEKWIPKGKKMHYRIISLDNPVEKRDCKCNWLARNLVFELQKNINNYDIISLLNGAYFHNSEKIITLDDYYVNLWFVQLIDDNGILEIKNNFYIKWGFNDLETIDFYLQYLDL